MNSSTRSPVARKAPHVGFRGIFPRMTCGLRATPPSLLPFGWVGCALPTPPRRNPRIAGFSLLEMLLVITLLGMLSLAAVVLTESSDDQARYDDTKNRLLAIKRAIIGDTSRTINGEPEISGFVADMGRLPACVRELLDGKCDDADPNPLAWGSVGVSGVAGTLESGWRGPYLDYLPTRSGTAVYLDGWGYDWSGVAQSLGKDNTPDGNEYNSDYPSDPLITEASWRENLNGRTITVRFNKVPGETVTLRLRIYYAQDGAIQPPHDSGTATLSSVAASGVASADFTFPNSDMLLALGRHAAVVWCDVSGTATSAVYDGTCSTSDTHAPYYFKLTPRAQLPTIEWEIQ